MGYRHFHNPTPCKNARFLSKVGGINTPEVLVQPQNRFSKKDYILYKSKQQKA